MYMNGGGGLEKRVLELSASNKHRWFSFEENKCLIHNKPFRRERERIQAAVANMKILYTCMT